MHFWEEILEGFGCGFGWILEAFGKILGVFELCCRGSPFLPSLSVSRLIVVIELFRPPSQTPVVIIVIVVVLCPP